MNLLFSVLSTSAEIGGKSLVKCLKIESCILSSEAGKSLVVHETENLDAVSASMAGLNTWY